MSEQPTRDRISATQEKAIRRRMEILRAMEDDPLPRSADWRAFYVHDVMRLLDEIDALRYEVSAHAKEPEP